jgi:hypothetical protein
MNVGATDSVVKPWATYDGRSPRGGARGGASEAPRATSNARRGAWGAAVEQWELLAASDEAADHRQVRERAFERRARACGQGRRGVLRCCQHTARAADRSGWVAAPAEATVEVCDDDDQGGRRRALNGRQ